MMPLEGARKFFPAGFCGTRFAYCQEAARPRSGQTGFCASCFFRPWGEAILKVNDRRKPVIPAHNSLKTGDKGI
jgi:hypothetical protein